MTIGMICSLIFGIVLIIVGVAGGVALIKDDQSGGGVAAMIIGIVVGLCFLVGTVIYSQTESGKRAIKDQKSEFGGGIDRVLTVYDMNGNVIKCYKGRFDVKATSDDTNSYIKFDDENGKRHLIYYTTGTIIVDEE